MSVDAIREACERLGRPELADRIRLRRVEDLEVPKVKLPRINVEYPAVPPMLSYSRPVHDGYEIVVSVSNVLQTANEIEIDVLDLEKRIVHHEVAHIIDMDEGVYGFEPVVDPPIAQSTYDNPHLSFMVAFYIHIAKDVVALARLKKAGVLESVERLPALEAKYDERAFVYKGVLNVPHVFQSSPTLLHILLYKRYAGLEVRGAHFELLSPILDTIIAAWRVERRWETVSRIASVLGLLAATAAYTSIDPVEQCSLTYGIVDAFDPSISRHVAVLCERLSRAVEAFLAVAQDEHTGARDESVRG